MNTETFTFNSISEFGDAVKAADSLPRATRHDQSRASSESWGGDLQHTLGEAIAIAQAGGAWEEGARKLQEIDITVDSNKDFNRRAIVQDVTGFMPNVPALLAGHPLAMFNQRHAPKARKYIKMGVSITAASNITASTLYNRGRAVVAVIDDLVTQGYGVELYACIGSQGSSNKAVVSVRLKPADGSWSVASAAFMLACSSVLRRLYIRLVENEKEFMDDVGGSYGSPVYKDHGNHDIWLPALGQTDNILFSTPERAMKTVVAIVQKHTKKQAKEDAAHETAA